MFRIVALISLSFLVAFSAYAECDFRSAWRGMNVVDYVPKARACLDNPGADIWFDADVEAEILARVNEERQSRGLTPLRVRPELLGAARIHSFDMAQEGFFAHEGQDGRVTAKRVGALDRTLVLSEVRENIARFGGDLDYSDIGHLLHRSLMNSPGHRENILAPNVTHIAIGLSRREKGAWVTQVFVRVEGTLDEPLSTAFSSGDARSIVAQLKDWTFGGVSFRDPAGGELALGDQIKDFRHDLSLVVLGRKRLDERRTATIKLSGPHISPVPQVQGAN